MCIRDRRTPDNDNGDGETCNNNLCVPIAFNVNDRAWYVRRPLHYAEDSKGLSLIHI